MMWLKRTSENKFMKLLWQLKHLGWNVCIWNMKDCRKPRNKHGIVFGKGDWTVVAKYYSSVGHHSGLLPWFPLFKMCGDWCFPRLCRPKSPCLAPAFAHWSFDLLRTRSPHCIHCGDCHLELPQHLPISLHFSLFSY